jgi:hypothetical protein
MEQRVLQTTLAIAATIAVSTQLAQASTLKADRAMTRLAASMVANSEDARQALTLGKLGVADSSIDRALSEQKKMAQIVRTDGTSMVVPIYTELDDTATLANALKVQAGRNARGGTGALVRRNAVDVTSVAIDLTKARARLDVARKAIADHNMHTAESSLSAVGSDLIVSSVAANVPLVTAREDLSLAQSAIDRNKPKVAAADLREAATALGRYDNSAHSNDVRSLASTIDAEAPLTRNDQGASTKIDAWWTSLKGWLSRHA